MEINFKYYCQKCGTDKIKLYETDYFDIYECPSCKKQSIVDIDDCCRNPNKIIVEDLSKLPHRKLYYQCKNCGGIVNKNKPLSYKKYQNEIKDEINFHRVEEWKLAKFNDIEYIKEIVNKYNFDLSKYGKYLRYIESEKWFILKNRIKKRDKNKCTKCNSNLNLHVHHITYDNLFNEKDEDLITLCSECHKDFHKDDYKKFL
jgi:ribosomal protein L37AE/L43A